MENARTKFNTPVLLHSNEARRSAIMKSNVTISKMHLLCLMITVSTLSWGWGSPAFAQAVRIAVGAASVASLPTWVAHDGGYFARAGVPAELIYIRGRPQTMSALVSGEVPFAQIYGGALVAAGLNSADVVILAGLIKLPILSIITDKGIHKTVNLTGNKIDISTRSTGTDIIFRL